MKRTEKITGKVGSTHWKKKSKLKAEDHGPPPDCEERMPIRKVEDGTGSESFLMNSLGYQPSKKAGKRQATTEPQSNFSVFGGDDHQSEIRGKKQVERRSVTDTSSFSPDGREKPMIEKSSKRNVGRGNTSNLGFLFGNQ